MDDHGFNRNGDLACGEKIKQSIRENPSNIYHASTEFRNKYEIMLECVKADPNTYEYATLHLGNKKIDLAIFFLESVSSFSLISNYLRNIKKVRMIAVEDNPQIFQYVGNSLKDDDEICKR